MSLNSQAAEIELLFLRGSLPREIDVPREPIRFADGTRDLSFADAIEYLVAQAKPVRCRARLSHGMLLIVAGPPTAEQLQFHNWFLGLPVEKPWQKAKGATTSDALRVKSGEEAAIASFEAFDLWQRDYIRTGSSTVVTGPQVLEGPNPDQPQWEVGVGYAGPPVESYTLQEHERVLCDRCRQQLAVAAFRDRSTTPYGTWLLCEHCLRAESGRELARTIGVDKQLSDEESHQLLDNVLKSMQEELRRGHDQSDSKESSFCQSHLTALKSKVPNCTAHRGAAHTAHREHHGIGTVGEDPENEEVAFKLTLTREHLPPRPRRRRSR